jgi:release factor glutamine methyltransferase
VSGFAGDGAEREHRLGASPEGTVRDSLTWAKQCLDLQEEKNPQLAAQWLLMAALQLSHLELLLQMDRSITTAEANNLYQAVQRRIASEPLQYIVGWAAFRHLELMVSEDVLIPRPETEQLVELVIEANPEWVLEIGCGSGAIALSLLQELPGVRVLATDISSEAVAMTAANAQRLRPDDLLRLELRCDDIATSLLDDPNWRSAVDVVVSNPPYIPSAEIAELPVEIRQFEPLAAIDGGLDGLVVYRRILDQARQLLKPGGLLVVELHSTKLAVAAELAAAAGYQSIQQLDDLTGRPRFLSARMPILI